MSAIRRRVGVAVSILVLSSTAFGQRFDEPRSMRLIAMSNLGLGFGARALSMGGAYAAVAEGLEAVGYNPAGLARITVPEFTAGANLTGQTVRFPPMVQGEYDWLFWPATGPRVVHSNASGFDHAGAAVRVKAGPQTFVVAFSFHRELAPRPMYEYSADINAANFTYWSYPDTHFSGTLAGTGTYRAESDEWLAVYTGSVAFRIARDLFFGVNVNWRRGDYKTQTITGTSFGVFDQDTELVSAQESLAEARSGKYSHGFSVDVGVLWQSRLLSLAAVYMSGFHLARIGTSSREESLSDSAGWSYDIRESGASGLTELWPGRFVVGAAIRPLRSLTVSGEIVLPLPADGPSQPGWTHSDSAPGFEQQYRMGLEYVLTRKSLVFPLRAGWALLHSNLYAGSEDDVRISAWTLGTGLHWRNFTFDIGALFHFASVDLPPDISFDPMKRTYWDAFLSLGYALKREP